MSAHDGPRGNASRKIRGVLASVLCIGFAGVAYAQAIGADCIEFWGEARYRNYGYDHVVHVNNHCEHTAVCIVATTVNPAPIRVTIAPSEEVEVITFRGSPSREFTPRVECEFVSMGGK